MVISIKQMRIQTIVLFALLLSLAFAYPWNFCRKRGRNIGQIYAQFDDLSHRDLEIIQKAHYRLLFKLRGYFYSHRICKYELYICAKEYIKALEYIDDKYYSDENNIIIGNYNTVKGENNRLKGDHHSVEGDGNFILNGWFPHHEIEGDNIVRIGKFDFDMDKVEFIKKDPCLAIKILSRHY